MALRCMQKNIRAFGGDLHAITIAGQSAGAISVQDLLASPLAHGLFQRAIAKSALPSMMPTVTLIQAEREGMRFMHSHGAKTLRAFRALPAQALEPPRAFKSGPRFFPIVDRKLIPAPVERLLEEGRVANVPVLIVMNANERSQSSLLRLRLSVLRWREFLHKHFVAMAPEVAHLYPTRTAPQRARAQQALQTDLGLGRTVSLGNGSAQACQHPGLLCVSLRTCGTRAAFSAMGRISILRDTLFFREA